jgi:hypothetical protein
MKLPTHWVFETIFTVQTYCVPWPIDGERAET